MLKIRLPARTCAGRANASTAQKREVRETNKRLRSTKRLVSLTSEAGGFVAGLWRLGQPGRLFSIAHKSAVPAVRAASQAVKVAEIRRGDAVFPPERPVKRGIVCEAHIRADPSQGLSFQNALLRRDETALREIPVKADAQLFAEQLVYGSFADGSANLNSDFDALIIAGKEKLHDSSFVDGVVLDVFVYPPDQFLSEYDPAEFAQVWDGKIILDKNGMGERLKKNVLDYIERIPLKTEEDVSQEIKWCEKMLLRIMRGDVEGYYRWHWVLCDSLEIYFDIKGIHYYGPKKALRFMEESDSEAFHIYSKALLEFNQEGLSDWINYLKTIF